MVKSDHRSHVAALRRGVCSFVSGVCVCASTVPGHCMEVRVRLFKRACFVCYRFISVIVITAVGANRVGSADETVGERLAWSLTDWRLAPSPPHCQLLAEYMQASVHCGSFWPRTNRRRMCFTARWGRLGPGLCAVSILEPEHRGAAWWGLLEDINSTPCSETVDIENIFPSLSGLSTDCLSFVCTAEGMMDV